MVVVVGRVSGGGGCGFFLDGQDQWINGMGKEAGGERGAAGIVGTWGGYRGGVGVGAVGGWSGFFGGGVGVVGGLVGGKEWM